MKTINMKYMSKMKSSEFRKYMKLPVAFRTYMECKYHVFVHFFLLHFAIVFSKEEYCNDSTVVAT